MFCDTFQHVFPTHFPTIFPTIFGPKNEFFQSDTLSTNVLAITPGECLMLDNLPETAKVLRNSGIKVTTFRAPALCIGCEGGPTCLTRPLYRI